MHRVELPEWQCHKKVRAAQIVAITDLDTCHRLHLSGGISLTVDAAWMERHAPLVGGYYVAYEDGYASFSPRAAFEGGYTLINS